MNLNQIIAQLNDLPTTFKRQGPTYPQLVASISAGYSSYTDGADEIGVESNFLSSARYGWLDVWGLLFGIPRNTNEADYNYRARILAVLMAWVGSLPAIVKWGELILNQTITVTENVSGGYTIIFPGVFTAAAINVFVQSLNRIRPAGVPFQVGVQSTGLYLDSINYLDCPAVIGSYLIDALTYIPLTIGASTNNAVPLLPSLYLNDPTLNPGL